MSAAVWIHQGQTEAWLVEVLPGLPRDPNALQPIVFSPSADFRYPLHLIAGCLESLVSALGRAHDVARAIVHGEVLYDNKAGDAEALLREARRVAGEE